MSRPIYETQQDRDNEQALAELIERSFSCTMHKMPMKYTLDFAAVRGGKVVAFLEMRQRRIPMRQYDTYMIALHKIMKAKEFTHVTGLPCFLVIRWTDAVGMVNMGTCEYDIEVGGSTRRNDWQDIEPMALIPMTQFVEITQ